MNTLATIGLILTTVYADSVCGTSQRFMTALVCKDGSRFLHCAPNNLKNRGEFCTNPNLKWSEAKCKQYGGYDSLDVVNTGCYSSSFLATTYNVTEDFCGTDMKINHHENVNLGFESGNLDGWSVSGPSLPTVVCDGTSPEGNCYAALSASGTGPGSQPNKLGRSDLLVTNGGGCNSGNHQVGFWYKFVAMDYLPYNDRLTVVVDGDSGFSSSTTVDVSQVGNYGNSGWKYVTVQLGQVPVGTKLAVSISAEITNVRDSALSSYAYFDGVSLVQSTVALPMENGNDKMQMPMSLTMVILSQLFIILAL